MPALLALALVPMLLQRNRSCDGLGAVRAVRKLAGIGSAPARG